MKGRIEEIYWLRFYGCLAVFLFHLILRIEDNYLSHLTLDLARIPLVLGTPIFIFISIFLFSARYGDAVPHHFLANRFKYVMVPYLVYGLIYSLAEYVRVKANGDSLGFAGHMTEYLVFAGWHGYFLIIAMQFYVLFWLYNRFRLWHWLSSGPGLVIGALISMGYWGYFRWQGLEPPGYLHWIAPIGWIYLFFLAVLLVSAYPNLMKRRWFRCFANPAWLLATVAGIVLFTLRGELEYSSKETWVVPLFIFSALWAMNWLADRPAPRLVKQVNEYSFGIYLAHPLFFSVVDFVTWQVKVPLWLYASALAAVGMGGSVMLNRIVNRSHWSGLMFGKRLHVP
ncbi:acyltransferase family protein [Billgrantia gudaonensis]|uniref:Membrane-bound acyltransferase YfiQ, involved in biofilm formation n=1 Tax=Billgrantia gudaonensis TaxID=376427 RepID=A0A1G9BE69_9GAMM|nr:acyltransferase family protein [Halomonas gudaonensis]SDK37145.1 Membrane-bound acyltransferase YfiQ, involved in biofilm formation [Halomonas gudaonensis]